MANKNKRRKIIYIKPIIKIILTNYLKKNKEYYTVICKYLPSVLSKYQIYNGLGSPDYNKNSFYLILN